MAGSTHFDCSTFLFASFQFFFINLPFYSQLFLLFQFRSAIHTNSPFYDLTKGFLITTTPMTSSFNTDSRRLRWYGWQAPGSETGLRRTEGEVILVGNRSARLQQGKEAMNSTALTPGANECVGNELLLLIAMSNVYSSNQFMNQL